MTKKLFAASLASLLASCSPIFSNLKQPPIPDYQKPPIYEQISQEDLSARLGEADKIAEENPLAALSLYRIIIDKDSHLKEAAIDRSLNIYKSLTEKVFSEDCNCDDIIENALNFYDEVIEKHRGNSLAKSYLNSGSFLWRWKAPYNFDIAIERLKEVLKIGTPEEKAEAAFNQAFIYWNYSAGFSIREIPTIEKKYSMLDVERSLEQAIHFAPNSDYAQRARVTLEYLNSKKPNKFLN